MKTLLSAAAIAAILSTGAFAQTAPSTTTPTTPTPMEKSVTPTSPGTSTTTTTTPMTGTSMSMTDAEVRNWLNKTVYSSDGKNLGEVANFVRDSSGKVTELHADIGGFLGIGETRVRLMPDQFKLDGDRVTVSMTSEQAKTLPKLPKS